MTSLRQAPLLGAPGASRRFGSARGTQRLREAESLSCVSGSAQPGTVSALSLLRQPGPVSLQEERWPMVVDRAPMVPDRVPMVAKSQAF